MSPRVNNNWFVRDLILSPCCEESNEEFNLEGHLS